MDFIKTITGISKFLHSDVGKKYIAKIYPVISHRLTARGFGDLVKSITRTYKFIDDEVYNNPGYHEDEQDYVVDHEETVVAESSFTEVTPMEDIWARVGGEVKDKLMPMHQKSIGTCAIHTVQNMLNTITIERGLEEKIETDISLMYRDYRWNKGGGRDKGTVVDDLFRKLKVEGIPLRTNKVILNRKNLLALDESETAEEGRAFRTNVFGEIVKRGSTIEKMIQDLDGLDTATHAVQVSIDVFRNKKGKSYWHNPLIKWEDGMYKSGRHSVAMLFNTINGERISIHSDNGNRGFWILDSGDGAIKFLTESYLDKARFNYRIVKFVDARHQAIPYVKPAGVDLGEVVIRYGDTGRNVTALQAYLGMDTSVAKFGPATKRALDAWQVKNLGKSYGGTHWGKISQLTYKALKIK